MKLDVEVNEIELSNVGATGEFKIRNSAKAFKILSDGLYSNKIKAVIRELSCNALDSHVAAGKKEVPFTVHLPSMMEPWFSVQDYGQGLDAAQVTNIYTTYFESTKTESNDFIGALGLGSKSPFSYTENFTVTAIKEGTKRIYSAFINEVGVPSIVEMSSELTDEINGVEVKFSVTNRYDYDSFRHEARNVFTWFKNKPEIVGVPCDISDPVYRERNVTQGIHSLATSKECYAVMGNIAYPLSKMSEPEKHLGPLAGFLKNGLVLEFEIGELDFAASREELSFIPLTINSIKRKLQTLADNILAHLTKQADEITSEWPKAAFLYKQAETDLYRPVVKEYVTKTAFPLYDTNSYRGAYSFKLRIDELATRNLTIQGMSISNNRYSHSISTNGTNIRTPNGMLYVKTMDVSVDESVVIVLNDLKTGGFTRTRYHYTKNSHNVRYNIYYVNHTDPDPAVRQVEYNKLIAELHNPPAVVMASTLEKKPLEVRTKLSSTGIMALRARRTNNRLEYFWNTVAEELDDTKIYNFVCLSNFDSQRLDGTSFNAVAFKQLLVESGIPSLKDFQIYGVRKSRIADIKGLKNWIWVEEPVKEAVKKLKDVDIVPLISADLVADSTTRSYTVKSIAGHLPATSDYARFTSAYSTLNYDTNSNSLVQLCKMYSKSIKVDEIKARITEEKNAVMAKYPLVRYMSANYVPTQLVVDYIKLVDKQ